MNIFELYKPLLLRRFQSSNHEVYLQRVHSTLFYVPQSVLCCVCVCVCGDGTAQHCVSVGLNSTVPTGLYLDMEISPAWIDGV